MTRACPSRSTRISSEGRRSGRHGAESLSLNWVRELNRFRDSGIRQLLVWQPGGEQRYLQSIARQATRAVPGEQLHHTLEDREVTSRTVQVRHTPLLQLEEKRRSVPAVLRHVPRGPIRPSSPTETMALPTK